MQWVQRWGKAGASAMKPVEHDGHHGEQRERRKDATDEGEAESYRHRASARFGAPAQIGTHICCQTPECRRDRSAESRAHPQGVGERAGRAHRDAEVAQCVVEALAERTCPYDLVEAAT